MTIFYGMDLSKMKPDEIRELEEKILDRYKRTGLLIQACVDVGVSPIIVNELCFIDPAFENRLRDIREKVHPRFMNFVENSLDHLLMETITWMSAILHDESVPPQIRGKVAEKVLEIGYKFRKQLSVEQKLEELERLAEEVKSLVD